MQVEVASHISAIFIFSRNITIQDDGFDVIIQKQEDDDEDPTFLGETKTYLLQGYTTVIMDFYTSTGTTKGKGFLIRYAAGLFPTVVLKLLHLK